MGSVGVASRRADGAFYYKIGGKSMGKRELVIALAFIVVSAVAYQFTAPDPKPNEKGFSFSRFWNDARREIRGNSAQASFSATGTVRSRELSDVRLGHVRGTHVG